jgi:vitamin B12 transporter
MAAKAASMSLFSHANLRSYAVAGALGLLPMCGIPASAQQTNPAGTAVELPQIVVSASQYPMDATRVGASVTVLSGEKLRESGVQTVADALRSVPGVSVTQSGGRGTLTEVRMRGGETNQTLVLIDGIEMSDVASGAFDFADLHVDDIERIEVVRGPQSGIYGSYAQTGVISIITLSGKGLAKPVVSAKIEGGSMDTISGSASVRGANGPAYGSFTVSDYRTGGYNISRFGSERDGSKALTVTGKAGADVTSNFNIEGVMRYVDRSAQSDPQDFNWPPGPNYGLVVDGNDRTTYGNFTGRLGATLKLLDGRWIQNANVKVYEDRTRYLSNDVVQFGADGKRTIFDYKSTFLFDTAIAGGEHHTVSFLVEDRRENYDQLFSATPYVKTRLGMAGEYVLDLPTNTTLSGALRHDNNSAFADVMTWRLALSQRFPAAGARLHTSAGKGITDPSVYELFGSTFNLPNPGLRPEQSIGWDAGVEKTWLDGRVMADVTYFSSNFTDKIELTSVGGGGFIYVNGIGLAPRRGVEVAGTVKPVHWLSMVATYTYTDARDSFGNQEVRRPPHSASLNTTALFPDGKTKLTIGTSYNSTRKDFIFTPTDVLRGDLASTTLVRANLSHDVTRWANIYLRAENLFNAHYEEVFSYRAPGFAAYAGLRLKTPD